MLAESRSALDLLARALAPLDALDAAAEIRPQFEQIRGELERHEVAIELVGDQRAQVIETLLGDKGLAAATTTTVRVRVGPELGYRARWSAGRVEDAPASNLSRLEAELRAIESQITDVTEEARTLAEQLQDAGRLTAHARAQLAAAETQRKRAHAQPPILEVAAPPAPRPVAAPPVPQSVAARSWWARFIALLLALFGRRRALPSAPAQPAATLPPATTRPATTGPAAAAESLSLRLLPNARKRAGAVWVEPTSVGTHDEESLDGVAPAAALERRVADEERLVRRVAEAEARLEMRLAENKANLVILGNHREQRRRARDLQRREHRARVLQRLIEITAPGGAAEVDLIAPELPSGVLLLLSPGLRDSIDARISIGQVTLNDRRLTIAVPAGASRDDLNAQIDEVRRSHPMDVARRLAATMRSCRGSVIDFDRRARQAHLERERELTTARANPSELREQVLQARAQLPNAGGKLLQETEQRWRRLLDEVERDWKDRMASCLSVEQLRAEVAAIEDGSAHRLSIARDELRDALTIQLVRLVLQLSHPVRQRLHDQRIAAVRDLSPSVEETLDELRVALPSAIGSAFEGLRVPDVTGLLSAPGLFSPLFRTLAREKKSAAARLDAQLDELRSAASDELAGLAIEPLLVATVQRVAKELVGAHERWIDAHLADESSAWQGLRQLLDPALTLIAVLEETAAALLRRVESLPA